MIKFTVPIVPVGQQRARHAAMRGKGGKVFSRTYKAKDQLHQEQSLQAWLKEHVPPKPIQGAVVLRFTALMPMPKSKPGWWKRAALAGNIYPTTVPDLDNLGKHLKDCMTTMRFWEDDKQVVMLQGVKRYSEAPAWRVEVQEIWQPQTAKEWEERRVASA